jgi:hypothetical protein
LLISVLSPLKYPDQPSGMETMESAALSLSAPPLARSRLMVTSVPALTVCPGYAVLISSDGSGESRQTEGDKDCCGQCRYDE